ncbi:MAG: AMP-binding protein [Spirochaetales bacterium]|nr:AMP-binding protein [Spirochaetales bacterium]
MVFIHEMLAKAAEKYPQKKAFICNQNSFTFSEIDEISTGVAHFLKQQGVKKGERIGIFSVKNIQEIIALFAIIKLGCVFVHINPHFKEDQLYHVISDCNIRNLFIHESKAKAITRTGLDKNFFHLIISLSSGSSLESRYNNVHYLDSITKESSPLPGLYGEINEYDPASIIYTSGSTGKPKGIIVTHRIFHDATVISAEALENNSEDRLISVTPFSFDGALSQLFTSIYAGGTLVLQESSFPKDIVDTMVKEKITGFHAVPSYWRMLLQRHSPLEKYDYPHLRYVSIIGEVFPRDDLMKLKAILKHTRFYMMYGITEAFRSTFLHPDDFDRKHPSAGKPFPGVEIKIIDDRGKECKAGEVGEIVHKGVFVSPGYWNNPEKTREVFKDGMVYTGDLGKMDEEGYIYFTGRKDVMLKSMGYRISPEEIEECLCSIPGVSEAAVCSVSGKENGNRIKAIIVCKENVLLTEKDIVNYCKAKLPYYMVPALCEFRSSLAKTGTFKINRSQLKQEAKGV